MQKLEHTWTFQFWLHPSQPPKYALLRPLYLILYSVGPKILKLRYVINAFKATSFAWILLLMRLYNNYSIDMYLYLVLYGSYGILWIVKDINFPDARWDVKASLGSGISLAVYFCIYWLIPVPLAADVGAQPSSNARIIFLLVLYLVGLVLMLGSDYQKYHTLKQRPGTVHITQDWYLQVFSNTQETPITWANP